jgi:hypothetical protein
LGEKRERQNQADKQGMGSHNSDFGVRYAEPGKFSILFSWLYYWQTSPIFAQPSAFFMITKDLT